LIWVSLAEFLLSGNKNFYMKKNLLVIVLLIGLHVYSLAQTTPTHAKKPTTSATSSKPSTAAVPKTASTASPTKKDGTPDMRYKSNKDAAKAAPATTHTKKDGTPDKRYKENKK